MLLGSAVIYVVRRPVADARPSICPLQQGLEFGLYPFVIGDMLKLLAAAGLLPAAWALMKRLHPED